MQKIIIVLLFILTIFHINTKHTFSFIPSGGQYNFGINSGPSTSSLGDAVISLKEGETIMKFSAPSMDTSNNSVQGHFSITTITNHPLYNTDVTVVHNFLEVGYLKKPHFSIQELQKIIPLPKDDPTKEYTLLVLEDRENEHILIMNNLDNQTTTFLGILPSRRGILLLSTSLDANKKFHANLSFFNNLISAITFKQNKKYSDFREGDKIYSKSIPLFLKNFDIIQEDKKNIEQGLNSSEVNILDEFSLFQNTTTQDSIKSKNKTENPGTITPHPQTVDINTNDSTIPPWLIPLGLIFLVFGTGKKFLKELKNETNKNKKS